MEGARRLGARAPEGGKFLGESFLNGLRGVTAIGIPYVDAVRSPPRIFITRFGVGEARGAQAALVADHAPQTSTERNCKCGCLHHSCAVLPVLLFLWRCDAPFTMHYLDS